MSTCLVLDIMNKSHRARIWTRTNQDCARRSSAAPTVSFVVTWRRRQLRVDHPWHFWHYILLEDTLAMLDQHHYPEFPWSSQDTYHRRMPNELPSWLSWQKSIVRPRPMITVNVDCAVSYWMTGLILRPRASLRTSTATSNGVGSDEAVKAGLCLTHRP